MIGPRDEVLLRALLAVLAGGGGSRHRPRPILVVEPGQNEITAAPALLKGLPFHDAINTGDAIIAQRRICRRLGGSRWHYPFAVKNT